MTWICKVCGYIHQGEQPPAACPLCRADSSKFERQLEQPAVPSGKGLAPSRWICKVCGYVHEGDAPPAICPVCKVDSSHFERLASQRLFPAGHRPGIARGVDRLVYEGLSAQHRAACEAVGQHLAMARAAEREGCPEASLMLRRIAQEKADHAARLAELLGEGVSPDTSQNLRLLADNGLALALSAKALSDQAKALGLEEIASALLDLARDQARHGSAIEGLLKRI